MTDARDWRVMMRWRTRLASCMLGGAAVLCGCNGSEVDGPVLRPPVSGDEIGGLSDPAASDEIAGTSDAGDDGRSDAGDGLAGALSGGSNTTGSSIDADIDVTRLASPSLVLDQFGYRPDSEKIALLRDPRVGVDADADAGFVPNERYSLVDLATGSEVLQIEPRAWNGGATDPESGDRLWRLDLSSLRSPGRYRLEDSAGATISAEIEVAADVYDAILIQAFRTFFYQRAGFAKLPPLADERWADGASHLAPGQDRNARPYDSPDDATNERDLSGGWYDAGDFNRYTRWSANYVVELLHAWRENPAVWGDDFGLPESGNGIPDLLDEVRWGVAWLSRMQQADGGMLSILDVDEASPPSAATGPSVFGPATTAASQSGAAALAFAGATFRASGLSELVAESASLIARAERAWAWAEANPESVFFNNDESFGTEGIGAGQQEPDAREREIEKLSAAIYLADAVGGESRYHQFVGLHYADAPLLESRFVNPFDAASQRDLLFHASRPDTGEAERERIFDAYVESMNDERFRGARGGRRDAYLSNLDAYVWGSNGTRVQKALLYLQLVRYGLDETAADTNRQAALDHLHYLHGVNPFGLVYLSNMSEFGAERSVDTIYHRWFADGSDTWDSVSRSRHGPLPGFLVGGPNPTYRPAECCPTDCPSAAENRLCERVGGAPFVSQPSQKSFVQFNEGFPLNAWQMTENSNAYQVGYLRLLAWFVSAADR